MEESQGVYIGNAKLIEEARKSYADAANLIRLGARDIVRTGLACTTLIGCVALEKWLSAETTTTVCETTPTGTTCYPVSLQNNVHLHPLFYAGSIRIIADTSLELVKSMYKICTIPYETRKKIKKTL